MNLQRNPSTSKRLRLDMALSLDDLVEEDKQVENDEQARQQNADNDDEEDELEAYMATIEKQESKRANVSLAGTNLDIEPDAGDELAAEVVAIEGKKNVDDLKADIQAAIAGANSSANKTIKRLNQLGTQKVKYLTFKKDFYQEVPELMRMTQEEVDELRLALENIKVVGKSCPKPITRWAHCGLSKRVMEVLKRSSYLSPTPIQAQAIPAIMSGRDVIGIAKTGCGKTLSFLLPMFRHILAQPRLEKGDGPIAIIITPTRELATQICDDAQKFAKVLGLRVVAVYGGPNISEQIGMLKPGAEIVVCTPGRMIEILTVNSGRVTNLNRCTFLVMDEADRLFDMGFEKQIRSIVDLIRPDRQTVMFSATFPKILEAHARKILTEPVAIQVGGRSIVCKDVHQTVQIIEEDVKFPRLLEIFMKHVDRDNSAIVFVSKQEKADSLLEDLMQNYDPNCLVLHGGIDKDDRISTFSSFKKGHARVLVATSVAARGLDVKNCICVVNYDCPNHYEDYVHRCGRTGRAGNKGFAYTFITPDQGQHAPDIIKALELSSQQVPQELQSLWDTYKADAEKSGKKIWTSSGFSGRGFKFDEAEAQVVNEKKKHQKKSLGMQNMSDDEDEGEDGDKETVDTSTLESQIRSLAGNKKGAAKTPVVRTIGGAAAAAIKAAESSAAAKLQTAATSTTTTAAQTTTVSVKAAEVKPTDSRVLNKLELAKQRAAMLCRKKGIEAAPAPPPSTEVTSPVAVESLVKQQQQQQLPADLRLASDLKGAERVVETKPIGRERLEMQMEINDYHQDVRRTLTFKETLNKVSEESEVGITVRGEFCAPGDIPRGPKLYLALEGHTQENLELAHRKLLEVVKDEYLRINSAPSRRFKMG